MVGMLTTKDLKPILKRLQDAGMAVDTKMFAGTTEVKDGDVVVLKGLQKGKGGPWIVTYKESENVKWGFKIEASEPVRLV